MRKHDSEKAYKNSENSSEKEQKREQAKSQQALLNTKNHPIRDEIGDNATNQYR
jgi:hypothetical protein